MNFKHLLLMGLLLIATSSKSQTTKVLFINNCPDLSVPNIDIHVDGNILYNDLFFRESTGFIDVNFIATQAIDIGVSEGGAASITDTLKNLNIILDQTRMYVMVINGISSTSGYSPSPKVSIDFYDLAIESTLNGSTEILYMNGATDAPVMDIRTNITTIGDDITYSGYSTNYTKLASNKAHILRLTNTKGNKTSHTYLLDAPNLNVDGKCPVILSSGFLNPAANSNGAEFGLYMALPNTAGPLIQLDTASAPEALARVQLIHNSADTGIKMLDVYVNNEKMLDSFKFRYATEYLDAYAGTNLNVFMTKAGTTDTMLNNVTLSLDSGKTYTAILYGISDSSVNYSPRPSLGIRTHAFANEEVTVPNTAEIQFMNSCTDVPPTDITLNTNPVFVSNLGYGQYSNYMKGITSPATGSDHLLSLDTGSTNTLMGKYILPYNSWSLTNKTATVVFSDFVDTAANSDGDRFSLWAATSEGGAMMELPLYVEVSIKDIVNKAQQLDVYPNPATNSISINAPVEIKYAIVTDITGKLVTTQNADNIQILDITNLNTGMYFILLQAKSGDIYYAKFSKL